MTIDEMRNSHLAIEIALLRVRHRHEKAGDAHKYTFGELLKEASKELNEQLDEMERTGKSKWDDLLKTKWVEVLATRLEAPRTMTISKPRGKLA